MVDYSSNYICRSPTRYDWRSLEDYSSSDPVISPLKLETLAETICLAVKLMAETSKNCDDGQRESPKKNKASRQFFQQTCSTNEKSTLVVEKYVQVELDHVIFPFPRRGEHKQLTFKATTKRLSLNSKKQQTPNVMSTYKKIQAYQIGSNFQQCFLGMAYQQRFVLQHSWKII